MGLKTAISQVAWLIRLDGGKLWNCMHLLVRSIPTRCNGLVTQLLATTAPSNVSLRVRLCRYDRENRNSLLISSHPLGIHWISTPPSLTTKLKGYKIAQWGEKGDISALVNCGIRIKYVS